MSTVKPPAASQQPVADRSKIDQGRTRTGADTDEPYVHRYKSVKMPGVAKGPILPESVSKFLRTRFRRKHTAAARQ